MKKLFSNSLILALVLTLVACGQKSHDHEGHDHEHGHDHNHDEASPNKILEDEVMKIHDEVMPKMNDIYKIKQSLKKKLDETTNLAADEKKKIENTIARLDSASDGMMIWMRQFNPPADSVAGEEKVREYLESELVKVKKVKDDMLSAIEEAGK